MIKNLFRGSLGGISYRNKAFSGIANIPACSLGIAAFLADRRFG